MHGYMGKILRVDLSRRRSFTEELDPDLPRRFLGGRGFGAKLLFDRLVRGADPLGPENLLIFSAGPLTGLPAPGSKISLTSKSPTSGGFGDSHVGGMVGPAFRYTGHDVMILERAADSPVYLFVDRHGAQVRDASHLWGKGCHETEDILIEENRQQGEVQVICIGPAGERMVNFACLTHDYGRQAGRTGMGAVMGSKRVKAIVFRGDQSIPLADPASFLEKVIELKDHLRSHKGALIWTKYGTSQFVEHSQVTSSLPTRNHRFGDSPHADILGHENMRREIVVRDKACFGCSMACGKYSVIRSGPYQGTEVDGPEYEILALMGTNTGMDNLGVVAKANQMADDLGMDAISAGNVCAFAMECWEKGIIDARMTDGLTLEWGKEDSYLELLRRIAYREGIGDLLANGVRIASRRLGMGSERFAMHSKGLEQSGYETRPSLAQVVAYSVNDRGADHNRLWNVGWFEGEMRTSKEDKPELIRLTQCRRSTPDILGQCRFCSYYVDFDDYGRLVKAATGMDIDGQGIIEVAERVFNLTRVFNYLEGYTREDDHVPPRVFEEPIERGPLAGERIDEQDYLDMRAAFYQASGWDEEGFPTREKLLALDLADVAKQVSDRWEG